MRTIWCVGLLMLLGVSSAQAESPDGGLPPPTYTLGGGLGFVGLMNVDYSRWLSDKTSVDIGVTPLLLLNVAVLGFSGHLPLHRGARVEHNVVVSGIVGGIFGIMDGSPAGGPGARVGYELMTRHFGFGLTGGGFLAVGPPGPDPKFTFLPDVRLTFSYVRR